MKNKKPHTTIRKNISILAASLVVGVVLQYYSSPETLSLSQGSLQNLQELNKEFEVLSIENVLDEEGANHGSLLMNSVLHVGSEEEIQNGKKLLFKMKNDPNNIDSIYTINLPEETDNLEQIAEEFADKIPEFDFVEPDYEIEIMEEEEEFAEILASPQEIARFRKVKDLLKEKVDETKNWPTVAVIDTGTDIIHQEIRKNRWRNNNEVHRNDRDDDQNRFVDDSFGWDFVNNSSRPYIDESGHGTHVSGLITKTTGSKIMPIKVIENKKGSMSNVIRGIKYATDQNADIINFSIGSPKNSKALQTAIQYAEQKGILLVAAAGNNGDTTKYYPAAYDSVFAVGVTNDKGTILDRSNYGEWVDVYAPGENMISTLPGNNYGYKSGTSQAAAVITAEVAEIRAKYPALSKGSIKRLLRKEYTSRKQ